MIPAAFDYVRAKSVDEALDLAARPGAKLLAGGQSLLPLMKLRLAEPETLVDIGRLSELRGVRTLEDGRLAVGALTTYAELFDTPVMHYGLLQDALPDIGDVQVRNRGTVGGSVAHCDPASDLPACLLALDAELVIRSRTGERTAPVDGFFQGPFESALDPGELITQIVLPAPNPAAGSAYTSLVQPASGYSMVGVAAVLVEPEPGGPIVFARVGVTGVGPAPYRARGVEEALTGAVPSAEVLAAAAARATEGVTVNSDIHADAAYRTAMAEVYARRALEAARTRLA
jgi:carbon-monoxide dehydrogenase medium subunit